MRLKHSWLDGLFVFIFAYLFILQIQAIWPFTIDDMYISLRYAKHWAAGQGLLWNTNSPPVEGYSNFSFVALGALAFLVHLDPVLCLKWAGVVGLMFTLVFTYLISLFWLNYRQSLIPCIALLVYQGQIIWAVSGFETTIYQALLCGTVYFCFLGLGYNRFPHARTSPRVLAFLAAGLLLSIAGLTRPEAPVFMLLFFLLLCLDKPQVREYRDYNEECDYYRGIFLFVLMLVLIFIPYFLWRWHYYGSLLPNSFYCKGFANDSLLLDWNYIKLVWPFAILALFACIKKRDNRYYFLGLPSVLYLIMLMGADPIVAFDNRLFLPAWALLLPLAWQGLSELLLVYFKKRDVYFTVSLSIISGLLLFFFVPSMSLGAYRYFKNNPLAGEQLRNEVVQWLDTYAGHDQAVVIGDAGYIPYQSSLNFIDSYCLNNASMTHYPSTKRYEIFCHSILQEKPQFIILTSLIQNGRVIYTPSDACLNSLLKKHQKYKLIKLFSVLNPESSYRYELFSIVY